MPDKNLIYVYDVRFANFPENVHHSHYIKRLPHVMFVLNNWAIKPANDYLFENKIASLEEQGYMTKIATTLSHYLGNPNGTELVCILGSGEEKNNHQALNTWVAYHSKEIFELRLEGVNPLEYLKEKLESQLNN